jgi:hypothetical protein
MSEQSFKIEVRNEQQGGSKKGKKGKNSLRFFLFFPFFPFCLPEH